MMMTIQEIEEKCDALHSSEYTMHPLELSPLTLRRTFFPLGFPVEIRTNSEETFPHCERKWGAFRKRFDTEPVVAELHLIERESKECPPRPMYYFLQHVMTMVPTQIISALRSFREARPGWSSPRQPCTTLPI